MPDHVHALLQQPTNGLIIPKFMQTFKRETSAYCRPKSYAATSLWQPCYDDVPVPGSEAITTKLNYMHYNPVKRGLVEAIEDYLWSSVRAYIGGSSGIVQVTNAYTGEIIR
jgi:putative transposase